MEKKQKETNIVDAENATFLDAIFSITLIILGVWKSLELASWLGKYIRIQFLN